jgi:hypothetical protein
LNSRYLFPGAKVTAYGNFRFQPDGGDPGNAILLNGVLQTANLEIGVPGFQPQVPISTSEFRVSPSGVKTPEEIKAFLLCLSFLRQYEKAPPTNLTAFSAAC